MNKQEFVDLIVLSLRNPRAAAKQIIDMNLPMPVLWNCALLVVILSVLLTFATITSAPESSLVLQMGGTPMGFTILSAGSMVMLIFGLYWTGRMLGGKGDLHSFIALVVWIQFLWLLAQLVQTFLVLLSPPLAALLGFASLGYGLWILIQFINEAHKLNNALIGAATLVLAALGVTLGLSILLGIIGVTALGFENYV